MGRVAGRKGHAYVDVSANGGAAATPVLYLNKWTLDSTADQIEVTAFGDTTKTYVQGLPDAKGTATGFYNSTATTGSQALLGVASSGVARNTYLYPDTPSSSGPYFFGTAFWSFGYDTDAGGASAINGTWSAATPFQAVG